MKVEQLIVAESRRYSQFSQFHLGFRLGFGSLFAWGPLHTILPFFIGIVDWTESRLKKMRYQTEDIILFCVLMLM